MGDGEAAGIQLGEQGLDVAQDGFAGGRIADMADGAVAGQALDGRGFGESVADHAHAALGIEALAVIGDDAGRLLAAMLEGVQAERGDRRGVGMAENAENAAFLAQAVGVRDRNRRNISGSAPDLVHAAGSIDARAPARQGVV